MPSTLWFRPAGLALAAAMMLGTAPAALLAATPEDTLVIAAQIDDIVSIDPAESFEKSGGDLINNVYDSLIELVPGTSELTGGIAESWDVAEDGVTFTFTIREGITFHSGNPVRAEDAAFSIQRAVKLDKTPAFILTQFGLTPDNVDERVTFEGNTLTILIDEPVAPTFVYNCLTARIASVVDKELVLENEVDGDLGYEWLKSNSAGSGAFRLLTFRPNESYVLEAAGDYWRGDVQLNRVFVRHVPEPATQRLLLERGDVDVARDLTPVDVEGIAGNEALKVDEAPAGYIYYLALNQKVEPLNNPAVIEAMRWLVDYQGMADTFLKGQYIPRQSFLPTGFLGALDETPYSLDIEKAKSILEEAGVEPFTAKLTVRNNQDRMEIGQALQNTFAQAGITLNLSVGAGAEVLGEFRGRQHEITLQSWGPDYPDPHTNASTFTVNPDNSDEAGLTGLLAWRTAYEPGELQEMTEAAVRESDADTRRAMYEEIQRIHRDTSPFIPMFEEVDQISMQANVNDYHPGGGVDAATYWLATK